MSQKPTTIQFENFHMIIYNKYISTYLIIFIQDRSMIHFPCVQSRKVFPGARKFICLVNVIPFTCGEWQEGITIYKVPAEETGCWVQFKESMKLLQNTMGVTSIYLHPLPMLVVKRIWVLMSSCHLLLTLFISIKRGGVLNTQVFCHPCGTHACHRNQRETK